MLEKLMGDTPNAPFQYKRLTEEEQKKRGILGRLVGVIADTVNPTRNGRHYSEQLWENVFENPIMKEKIANRCCFGELNHPPDRTDTDIEKVAICLAEQPKIGKDGKLYGVFDILSTPCGKILKSLCDYGCKIGISSRGQGDLIEGIDGEEVDPDTYDCECFDAVLVPGVEIARLKYVNENLNSKKTLNKILNESFRAANNDDEIRIMKEQFKELNLLKEEDEEKNTQAVKQKDEQITEKEDSDNSDNIISFDDEEVETEDNKSTGDEDTQIEDDESADDEDIEIEDDEELSEEEKAEIFLDYLASNFDEDKIKEVCDILDIEIEGEEKEEEEKETTEEETDEKSDSEADNINDAEKEVEEKTEEAKDNGSKVLVDSLKEALKAKGSLEAQVRVLQEKLAASDTRVNEMTEECGKYKSAISRLSVAAKSGKDLKANTSKLEEALAQKDKIIESQKARIARLVRSNKLKLEKSNSVNEGISKKDAEITKLNEDLKTVNKEYQEKLTELNEKLNTTIDNSNTQITKLNEDLVKTKSIANKYKTLANKTMDKYIGVKADMLGVTAKDIKRKLGESYTFEDVDQICEDLKSYQLNISRLPFGVDRSVSIKGIKVNEAVKNKNNSIEDDDDSISDTLFVIADIND